MEDTLEERKSFDTTEYDRDWKELLEAVEGLARSDEKMRQRLLEHQNIH